MLENLLSQNYYYVTHSLKCSEIICTLDWFFKHSKNMTPLSYILEKYLNSWLLPRSQEDWRIVNLESRVQRRIGRSSQHHIARHYLRYEVRIFYLYVVVDIQTKEFVMAAPSSGSNFNIVESYIQEVCSFKKALLGKKLKVRLVRSDRIWLMFELVGVCPDLIQNILVL